MIYIGNFLVLTDQEKIAENDRRNGEFSLIVDAGNTSAALRSFKACILEYRLKKEFFQGDCQFFLIQLLELDRLPTSRAMMLTYKSTVGDPVLPYIGCLVPGEDTDGCRIFDWQDKRPQIDGQAEHLFMEFKTGGEIEQ
ncbi:MAG: hypothetical protein DSY90_07565 [Deltaproteobacteria bacterium]|nr:MAG: hypothetical protein DSY90_07565 [Deltaproteobacteria bacterium]